MQSTSISLGQMLHLIIARNSSRKVRSGYKASKKPQRAKGSTFPSYQGVPAEGYIACLPVDCQQSATGTKGLI